MPLIQCPDCDKPVSTSAITCPHCGRPVTGPRSSSGWRRVIDQTKANALGNPAALCALFVVILLAIILRACGSAFADTEAIPTHAKAVDVQVVKGICSKESHIAEGAMGSDLTKRRSRFFCDSAVMEFFDHRNQHIMVQFAKSKSDIGTQIGFAGIMQNNGRIMLVSHVYLGTRRIDVTQGECKFIFQNEHMHDIVCGAPMDKNNRRTVAVVVFKAAPGQ